MNNIVFTQTKVFKSQDQSQSRETGKKPSDTLEPRMQSSFGGDTRLVGRKRPNGMLNGDALNSYEDQGLSKRQ